METNELATITAEAAAALAQAQTPAPVIPAVATPVPAPVSVESGAKSETPAPVLTVEQTIAAAVGEIAAQIEAGAKAAEREEQAARINAAVQAAVAEIKAGRKTPMDMGNHPYSIAPAVISQRGEKATFNRWLVNAGRKALGIQGADREMYDIFMAAGGKALAEGTGATLSNTISGPNGGWGEGFSFVG